MLKQEIRRRAVKFIFAKAILHSQIVNKTNVVGRQNEIIRPHCGDSLLETANMDPSNGESTGNPPEVQPQFTEEDPGEALGKWYVVL
jgi:hypothetical protein